MKKDIRASGKTPRHGVAVARLDTGCPQRRPVDGTVYRSPDRDDALSPAERVRLILVDSPRHTLPVWSGLT